MTDKLTPIREALPAVQNQIFLNSGWYGPLPTPAQAALAAAMQDEYTGGRPNRRNLDRVQETRTALEEAFAAFFRIPLESLALTHHTTDGMNIVTMGFNWEPGDEVATTTIEHPAGIFPLYTIQDRYGVRINFADVGLGEDPLDAIDAALTPRTRLLSLSHVSYSTGARLPLEEIIALAHAKGIPVLVDGAQSAGVFDLDLAALNVDFYAIPGQKWLCGPEGVGMLYIRPDHLPTLRPTYANFNAIQSHDWRGRFTFNPTARRFETGTIYPPAMAGMQASLRWLMEEAGQDWAYARIARIAAYAREAIGSLPGVRLLTPEKRQASLVNFLPVGWSPAQMSGLIAALDTRGIIIRNISHVPYAVRVSCGFYNTEAEIDALREALAELLAAGPGAVTVPERAVQSGLSNEPVW